jgi:hypothetical protein
MTVLTFIGNGKAEASTEVTKVDPFKLETDYQKPVQEFGPYEWQYNVSVGRAGPVDSPEVIVEIQMHQSGEIMGVKTETVESTSYYPEQQIIIKEIKDKLKALGWYDNRFD